jgi:hypothetical protein
LAIPGYPGNVVNNGLAFSNQAVKKSRFSNVRTAYYSDDIAHIMMYSEKAAKIAKNLAFLA